MSDTPEIARARRIFADALNVPAPDPDVDIIQAGLIDSLALVTLLFELEREFDVELPLETLDVDDFRTISNIVRALEAQRHKASA
jgi:D-alanine--poly(phosphoribitol) ligase subunit 2